MNVFVPVIVCADVKSTKFVRFTPDKLFCTNAVVAICVLLVPVVAVGAKGVPVNVGLANGAYVLEAEVCDKYVLAALLVVK